MFSNENIVEARRVLMNFFRQIAFRVTKVGGLGVWYGFVEDAGWRAEMET